MELTQLFRAVEFGNLDDVKEGLASGIDVNVRDENGNTLLMGAIWFQQKEIAEYLVSQKPDFFLYNNDDESVFSIAETMEDRWFWRLLVDNCLRPEEVIYLISHHASPREVQEDGIIGAYINCYVVADSYQKAYDRCVEMIEIDGWDILEKEEETIIDWSKVDENDDDREYIELAIIDKEVMLIYGYSKEDEDINLN